MGEKKTYLFVYDGLIGRSEVKAILKRMPEVLLWRYDLPSCFYVVSENSAEDLARSFKAMVGDDDRRYIFSEITENHQGWLVQGSWHIINKKELLAKD